jgi:DNA invertase Pin-like site-specific DNA recombinase
MTLATPERTSVHRKGTVPVRVAAYLRVSTAEQADSGAGLDAQSHAIVREAERRGWPAVCTFVDAGVSGGKAADERAALSAALEFVEASRGVLVVSKLDRLTRSLRDFAELMERSRRRGWSIIALDLAMDTTTPSGELLASVVATVAQYERRMIGVRTRDALAAKKRQGVQLGRRRTLRARVIRYVCRLRAAGLTHEAIAARLNERRVPTAHGGARWYRSTVAYVLGYAAA